jgi:hypothetical protein
MSLSAQSYPQQRLWEVPPKLADYTTPSTGVESDVELEKGLQIA